MNKYLIEDTSLSSLAGKIREKLGVSDKMLPSAMPGKIGEISATGGGEGVYAWKRTKKATVSFTQLNSGVIPLLVQCSSDDIDLTTVDATFFHGMTGVFNKTNRYTFTEDTKFKTNAGILYDYTYDPTTMQLSMNCKYNGIYVWEDCETVIGTDYILADEEDAYLESGIGGDGHTYEQIVIKSGPTCEELEVGSSVFLRVNGVSTEFIVIHQGNPDTAKYDSSCDGTWLLMKDVYIKKAFDSSNNDYKNSDVHTYLNNTFLGLLSSDVRSAIKQVKIPYWNGPGKTGSLASGASGLSAKIFLLSEHEVGTYTYTSAGQQVSTSIPDDGSTLAYFAGTASTDAKRISYLDGVATVWWLRSPRVNADNSTAWVVDKYGSAGGSYSVSYSNGIRPALILPKDYRIY